MNEEKPQEKNPKEEPAKPEPQKKERPKECVACNKSIDKKWYYREGDYYCGKGCWKKSKKEAQDKK